MCGHAVPAVLDSGQVSVTVLDHYDGFVSLVRPETGVDHGKFMAIVEWDEPFGFQGRTPAVVHTKISGIDVESGDPDIIYRAYLVSCNGKNPSTPQDLVPALASSLSEPLSPTLAG